MPTMRFSNCLVELCVVGVPPDVSDKLNIPIEEGINIDRYCNLGT